MDEYNKSSWIGGIIGFLIIGAIIWWFSGVGKYEGQNAEYWFNAYDAETAKVEELENRISDFETALQEANDNIETANSQIRRAKGYAWESYTEMGEILESLRQIDTVSEP